MDFGEWLAVASLACSAGAFICAFLCPGRLIGMVFGVLGVVAAVAAFAA